MSNLNLFSAWLNANIEAWNAHYTEQQSNEEFDLSDSFDSFVAKKAEELPCSASETLANKIACYISNDDSETPNIVFAIQLLMAGTGDTLGIYVDDISFSLWQELEFNDNEWVYQEMVDYAVVYDTDMRFYSIVTQNGDNGTSVVSLHVHDERPADAIFITQDEYKRFIELGIKAA